MFEIDRRLFILVTGGDSGIPSTLENYFTCSIGSIRLQN